MTSRALSERLATGPGAIYHHVANKDELLGAATDAVVGAALATESSEPAEPGPAPQDAIRALALGLFEAIEEHPWLATQISTQLSRNPWRSVAPRIFESIGRQVRALGVPESAWFTATSALMHYVLGAAGLNAAGAANGRLLGPGVDRNTFLDAAATAWEELDADDYPFTRTVADRLRTHDDRGEFLAGLDLLLTGITAFHLPVPH